MKDSIFKNKTFYLMIALCLIIFGVTVYVGKDMNGNKSKKVHSTKVKEASETIYDDAAVRTHADFQAKKEKEMNEKTKKQDVSSKKVIVEKNNLNAKATQNKHTVNVAVNKNNTAVNNESKETVDTAVNPGVACLAEPVDGILLKPYSYKPLYSKTLGDLRAHEALDISAKANSSVKSACDGLVKVVNADHYLGKTVVVEYNASIKVQYSNLSPNVKVKVGQSVKQGQLIGYIGNTARNEIEDKPHLHFAVMRDNQYVDPTKYFINAKVASKYQDNQENSVQTMKTSNEKNNTEKTSRFQNQQVKNKVNTVTTTANSGRKKLKSKEDVQHYLRSMPANFDGTAEN